jgi:hypothetical protein
MWHVPFAAMYLVALFKCCANIRLIAALLLSFFANLFSFLLFSLLVVSIVILFFNYYYTPVSQSAVVMNTVLPGASLALIYTLLQALFFMLINIRSPLNVWLIITLSLIANAGAALTVYALLPAYV